MKLPSPVLHSILAVVLLFAMQQATAQQAYNFVVFFSTNIGVWPPGHQLRSGQEITLAKGETLRAIDSSFEQIVLRGPGMRVVPDGAPASKVLDALRSVLAARRDILNAFVTRQGKLPSAPDPWWLDTTATGNRCLKAGASPRLWQPAVKELVRARLSMPGRSAWFSWESGEATADWPASIPVVQGVPYRLEVSSLNLVREFVIVILTDVPADPIENSTLLLLQDCTAQAHALLESARPLNP
jgi:hypothetical protein